MNEAETRAGQAVGPFAMPEMDTPGARGLRRWLSRIGQWPDPIVITLC